MSTALETESLEIAHELRAVLEAMDPTAWRDELESALRERVATLRERLDRASDDAMRERDARLTQLRESLRLAATALEEWTPGSSAEASWREFQQRVQPVYDMLVASMRRLSWRAPRPLRPTNITRSLVHVGFGVTSVALVRWLPSTRVMLAIALAFTVWAWSMEIGRRVSPRVNALLMKLFGPIAHAHERERVNSSTWMTTGLAIIAALFPRAACAAAVATLAVGDPVAGMVGRRWGRTKLRTGRSLEGTLGFVAAAFVVCLGVFTALFPLGLGRALAVSAVSSVVGALAELFSTRVDDNFSIPVTVAAASAAAMALLGS